ncbi:MAG: hypothetical protein COW01_05075 [Bdellovibrionales bacterium CG12_big_fil_rev_8_21_14_0_65_38_15]|nr:MAG: hypothetical protein COW79_14355 [Bdellovibrionales bacterium CG22_combo_CG10-13_8_21_14_all_38_13]PIQ56256.1 MAG: hypothetical protein COW01_05075 [Bdellovibrionales bacterium CG12_big_fil_rev_8_21_14_0_65_38_15]PIR30400.1 MAG: hypothetical protein COV38_06520 [Bdellovibrionales bacterium CG11_big_fil_rev_8_21_14_0_20_38_13]
MLKKYKTLLKYILCAFLLFAGTYHLVNPQAFMFLMPPYFPMHLEIILFTGVLEIIFALGILFERTRNLFAVLTALYFIAIIPAHLHVAMNNISMLGITSPFLLWGRVLFQLVFIRCAWSLR